MLQRAKKCIKKKKYWIFSLGHHLVFFTYTDFPMKYYVTDHFPSTNVSLSDFFHLPQHIFIDTIFLTDTALKVITTTHPSQTPPATILIENKKTMIPHLPPPSTTSMALLITPFNPPPPALYQHSCLVRCLGFFEEADAEEECFVVGFWFLIIVAFPSSLPLVAATVYLTIRLSLPNMGTVSSPLFFQLKNWNSFNNFYFSFFYIVLELD